MRPLLHIPDGFLAPQVALAFWVASALVAVVALRKIGRRTPAAATQTILMGLSGAFIFAAQMFNFPVAAGTSGHLLGGVLAGYLLGPWAGSVVMATVIGIQALLFQDGGVLALGANIFNMGVIGTLGGFALYSVASRDDIATAAMGAWIVWEARNLGMSKLQMARMFGNVGIDWALGLIPFVGAVPDFFFRSNTRNLRIIRKHLDRHYPATATIIG